MRPSNKHLLRPLTVVMLLSVLAFAACHAGSYGSGSNRYPGYDRGYGYDRDDRYDDRYDSRYDRYSDDDDDRRHPRHENRRNDDDDDRDRYHGVRGGNKPRPPRSSAFPKPRPSQAIGPNCPAGTRFDGRSCIIVDKKLRKKGGDGRINPCPKGMWLSGDRCVPDR